jgi:hypothetical protein
MRQYEINFSQMTNKILGFDALNFLRFSGVELGFDLKVNEVKKDNIVSIVARSADITEFLYKAAVNNSPEEQRGEVMLEFLMPLKTVAIQTKQIILDYQEDNKEDNSWHTQEFLRLANEEFKRFVKLREEIKDSLPNW